MFLWYEWYTILGSGLMGSKEKKLESFRAVLKFIDSETVYIPDVYHITLHILIIVVLVTTISYCANKKEKNKFCFKTSDEYLPCEVSRFDS